MVGLVLCCLMTNGHSKDIWPKRMARTWVDQLMHGQILNT